MNKQITAIIKDAYLRLAQLTAERITFFLELILQVGTHL